MAFSASEKTKIAAVIQSFLAGAEKFTNEEIDLASKVNFGDLVVEFWLDADKARRFENIMTVSKRRNERVGFSINKLTESKKRRIIREEIEAISLAKPEDYHPVGNASGGKKFEDHSDGEQAGMIKSNLYSISSKAQSLHDMIGDTDELPEWVQEKIAVADEMIDTIKDYLEYEYRRSK